MCSGEIHVKIKYPERRAADKGEAAGSGGDLPFIQGAVIQAYWPGNASGDFEDIGQVRWPVREFCWVPPDDGSYAIRYAILTRGIVCSSTGKVHCVARSGYSPPAGFDVMMEPAETPVAPVIGMDCADCELELAD